MSPSRPARFCNMLLGAALVAAPFVALSIVGTDRTPDNGYFSGRKRRQCYGKNLP